LNEHASSDKSDPKDAVLIARLASELRCYEPERADAVWARLRLTTAGGNPGRGGRKTRAGRARTSLEDPTSRMSTGSPARLLTKPDSRCREQPA
jgi:hypothetical protein